MNTNIYGYPPEKAAAVAVATAGSFLEQSNYRIQVTFCCFSAHGLNIYNKLLAP